MRASSMVLRGRIVLNKHLQLSISPQALQYYQCEKKWTVARRGKGPV